MRILFSITTLFFLVACKATYDAPPVTAAQAALIANPSPQILARVEAQLPGFLSEDVALEKVAFKIGRPLNARETQLAKLVGVNDPSRVRLAVVPKIPSDPSRQDVLEEYAGLRVITRALAAGYGIILAAASQNDIEVLAHELVHVRQFEELGREGLARQVLIERAVLAGKTVIPIETEAVFDSAAALGTEPAYYPY